MKFQTTRWSIVNAAGGGDSAARSALQKLCETYWYPLYAYVRRGGATPDDPRDPPILAWLVLLPNRIVMGFGPASPLSVLAISLAFGAMIGGVVWTIAAAGRGLQDRIARTWVVPH